MKTLLAILLMASPCVAAGLTVGAAQVDITPPEGLPMAGYYHPRKNEGSYDKLYAKAIVFEKDGVRAALVMVDLIATTFEMTTATRKEAERLTKIPGTNVMLFATHSHTGPVISAPGAYSQSVGGSQKSAKDYMTNLPAKIALAVQKADAARKPAVATRGVVKEEKLAFNRRFHMKDGSIGWNPGKMNPDVLKPAGGTDPDVSVVQFLTTDKQPKVIANFVNFTMHMDTVGGLKYSADFSGTLAESLAQAHGEQAITLFATGASGDINHLNVSSDRPQKGHEEGARIGVRLAGAAQRAIDQSTLAENGPLLITSASVELSLPVVEKDDLEPSKAIIKKILDDVKPAPKFYEQVKAFQVLDVSERLGQPHTVEVQVITLGDDLAWVSLPGEVFVELGLQIKHASPFPQTMNVGYANGIVGYIPSRHAYTQGAYEVISARVAAGSGEKLVDAAAKQLRARRK